MALRSPARQRLGTEKRRRSAVRLRNGRDAHSEGVAQMSTGRRAWRGIGTDQHWLRTGMKGEGKARQRLGKASKSGGMAPLGTAAD